MRKSTVTILLVWLFAASSVGAASRFDSGQSQTIVEKTAGAQQLPGYFPIYWDAKQGKLWLEIDKWDSDFLYQSGLSAEWADRHRSGPIRPTVPPRSSASSGAGPKCCWFRKIWTTVRTAATLTSDAPCTIRLRSPYSGALPFPQKKTDALWWTRRNSSCAMRMEFLRCCNAPNRVPTSWTFPRSVIYLPKYEEFPLNTEVEATLTFTGREPGSSVREVTPDPEAIAVREHHFLVRLPPPRAIGPDVQSAQRIFCGISYKGLCHSCWRVAD